MKNRYQTIDVSLSLPPNNNNVSVTPSKRFSNTIDFQQSSIQLPSIGQNDDRVNKFRDLYYKNQKLRKQLKLLNLKLNQKLQKVKLLPAKRKKAQSVDLNVQTKPTKALERELQNAHKQASMYKKQISTLKIKQQSEATYEKYKNLDNSITFMDLEIVKVQAELTSIKNVKKIQDKTLVDDTDNPDLKDKLRQLERQIKQGQQKLKDIAKKARKRDQQYKKQQAYQVALQKKLRKPIQEQPEQDIIVSSQKPGSIEKEVSDLDFKNVKDEHSRIRQDNQILQKRLDLQKKTIRDYKKRREEYELKCTQRQAQFKSISLKLESYRRLIRDNQKKMLTTNQMDYSTNYNIIQKSKQSTLVQEDSQDEYDLQSSSINPSPNLKNHSIQVSNLGSSIKDERQWKDKPRRVNFGFMDSNDNMYKCAGQLRGIKAWIDQQKLICGLAYIYIQDGSVGENVIMGTRTNHQLRWDLPTNDAIAKIQATFTQQGYLAQLVFTTYNATTFKFGNQAAIDKFNCKLDREEHITGLSCGVRKLGQDTRITQLGFWVTSKN